MAMHEDRRNYHRLYQEGRLSESLTDSSGSTGALYCAAHAIENRLRQGESRGGLAGRI
jgi:hypothetical protein